MELRGAPQAVVACHCSDCQRRSGSPFGVLAYCPADQLVIAGEARRFERVAASGGSFETYFCPHRGSTVYARASKYPTMLAVAAGAIADPNFQEPIRSVWEQSMHRWVRLPDGMRHFPKGRT